MPIVHSLVEQQNNGRLHLTPGPVIRLAGQAGRPGRFAAPGRRCSTRYKHEKMKNTLIASIVVLVLFPLGYAKAVIWGSVSYTHLRAHETASFI